MEIQDKVKAWLAGCCLSSKIRDKAVDKAADFMIKNDWSLNERASVWQSVYHDDLRG